MIATASHHLSATASRRKLVIGLAATTISVAFVTATVVAGSTAPIRTAQTAVEPGSADHDRVTSPIPASATTLHAERDLHRITSPIPAYATTLHADDSAVVSARGGPPGVCAPVKCAAMVVDGPAEHLRAEVLAVAATTGRPQLDILLERVHLAFLAQVRTLAADSSARPTAFMAILDRHDAVRAILLAAS